MKKTLNRLKALLGLPITLLWLFIWKIAGNKTEVKFHVGFLKYLIAVVKTGKMRGEEKVRRVYP